MREATWSTAPVTTQSAVGEVEQDDVSKVLEENLVHHVASQQAASSTAAAVPGPPAAELTVDCASRDRLVRTDTAPFGMGRPASEVVESETTTPPT